MAISTTKKVLVQRFDRESLPGYVNPATFILDNGLEFLSLSGAASVLPYADVKAVYFVRDIDLPPLRPDRRTFMTRPKMDGLWVRLTFRDREQLEGVISSNLLQMEAQGFTLTPPDFTSNAQKLFVPRAALSGVDLLGVVRAPARGQPRRKPKDSTGPKQQISLFD